MAFSDALTNDQAVFYNTDEFAVAITYNGTSIDAVVSYGDAGREGEERRDFKAQKGKLAVKYSDVSLPAYRDIVVIASTTWYVQRIISGDGTDWIVGIETKERPTM